MTDPLQQDNSPAQPAPAADVSDSAHREPSFKESPSASASPQAADGNGQSATSQATASGTPGSVAAGAMSFGGTLRFAGTVALVCIGVLFLGRTVVSHVERHIPSNVTAFTHGLFGSNQTCYRTIDMQRLTARMVADLLTKTNGKSADEASAFYKSRVHEMDDAINAVADQCVLLRRDAVVSAPADIDVTAQIASRLGLDLNAAPTAPAGTNAVSAPAVAPATPSPASGTDSHAASDPAGNPKLDE
jgi:hypothetical protein